MAWFSRKKESPDRKALREQFESVTTSLRQADEMHQIAIGHSINMANSLFLKRFASASAFRSLPKPDKLGYISALTSMEEKLGKEDPHSAVGLALFKMWVGVLAENDDELIEKFSRGLAFFSRKGAIPA